LFIFSAQIFVSAGKPPVCGGTNFCPPRAGKTEVARRRGLEEYVPMRPQTFLRGERMLPFETRFGENGPAPDFHSEFTLQNLLRDARESRLYAQRFRQLMHNFYPGLDLFRGG